MKPRRSETIGGGYFVFRRGKRTGRVGIRTTLPFEHPDLASATAEASRLARENPGETYEVFQSTGVVAKCTTAPTTIIKGLLAAAVLASVLAAPVEAAVVRPDRPYAPYVGYVTRDNYVQRIVGPFWYREDCEYVGSGIVEAAMRDVHKAWPPHPYEALSLMSVDVVCIKGDGGLAGRGIGYVK